MLRYVPSVPTFWRGFFKIINGCWILKKAFSAWLSYGFYCMKCVNVVLSHWFADIEKCLYLWDKYQLHMVYWSFKCIAEFGLLVFCWGFLLLCSSVILACNFLFFVMVLVSGWCWPHWMKLEVFLPLQCFEIVSEG